MYTPPTLQKINRAVNGQLILSKENKNYSTDTIVLLEEGIEIWYDRDRLEPDAQLCVRVLDINDNVILQICDVTESFIERLISGLEKVPVQKPY